MIDKAMKEGDVKSLKESLKTIEKSAEAFRTMQT
jgi:hypothetical protein